MTTSTNFTSEVPVEYFSDSTQLVISKMDEWISINFPDLKDKNWTVNKQGFSSPTFIIGNEIVAKVYVYKWGWGVDNWNFDDKVPTSNIVEYISKNKNVPKTFKFTSRDDFFEAPVLVQKYLPNSRTLSDFYFALSKIEKNKMIGKYVKIIKNFHNTSGNQKMTFDTNEIKLKVISKIAKNENRMSDRVRVLFENLVNSYTPRLLTCKQKLIHNDLHFANVIESNNKIYLIDFDGAKLSPLFMEINSLIRNFFFLAQMLYTESQPNYPSPMIEEFEMLKLQYPEIFDEKYKEEMNLLIADIILEQIANESANKSVKIALKYFFDFEE